MNSPIIRVGFLGFFGRGWLRTDGSLLLLFWSLGVWCASVFVFFFLERCLFGYQSAHTMHAHACTAVPMKSSLAAGVYPIYLRLMVEENRSNLLPAGIVAAMQTSENVCLCN